MQIQYDTIVIIARTRYEVCKHSRPGRPNHLPFPILDISLVIAGVDITIGVPRGALQTSTNQSKLCIGTAIEHIMSVVSSSRPPFSIFVPVYLLVSLTPIAVSVCPRKAPARSFHP